MNGGEFMKAIFADPAFKWVTFNNPLSTMINGGDVNKYIRRMSPLGTKLLMSNLKFI